MMKCGIWQPVKFQLVSPLWPGSKMKCFSSYLRINNGDHFIFLSISRTRDLLKFYSCQVPHFMTVLIPYINLLNLSWIIKCLFLRNMEPLRLMPPKWSCKIKFNPNIIFTHFCFKKNSSDCFLKTMALLFNELTIKEKKKKKKKKKKLTGNDNSIKISE